MAADTDAADVPDEDHFDAEAETVTDAFEGVFVYTSWGYGQTNVEMARIEEVSDTGKTVLARLVRPERVTIESGSERLRPTAETYGEAFRLHVRNAGGKPSFRGSYPYVSGDPEDGTRRGSFGVFSNAPEATVHQTAHGHRH